MALFLTADQGKEGMQIADAKKKRLQLTIPGKNGEDVAANRESSLIVQLWQLLPDFSL